MRNLINVVLTLFLVTVLSFSSKAQNNDNKPVLSNGQKLVVSTKIKADTQLVEKPAINTGSKTNKVVLKNQPSKSQKKQVDTPPIIGVSNNKNN